MAQLLIHILHFELLKTQRDKTLWLILGALGILTFFSVYNGNQWLEFQRSVIEHISTAAQEQKTTNLQDLKTFESTGKTAGLDVPANPTVMYFGKRMYAVKVPSPWSVFCVGQSDAYGFYQIFTGINEQELLFENEIVSPLHLFWGKFDYAFFILYLLPLLIIASCFDVLSQEKELQTSTVVFTQHVSLFTFLIGKCVYRFAKLFFSLSLFTLGAIACFEPLLFSEPTTLSYILLLLGSYVFFWILVCLLTNLLHQSSVFNGVVLVAIWILMLYLIPSFFYVLSTVPKQPLSRYEELAALKFRGERIQKDSALIRFNKKHPEWLPENITRDDSVVSIPWYPSFIAWQLECVNMTDSALLAKENRMIAQERHSHKWHFLLPPMVIRDRLLHLSRNSTEVFISFKRACRAHHKHWQLHMAEKIFLKKRLRKEDIEGINMLEWQ